MTGLREPKVAKVLHESHTQSTDAPQMPPPSAGPVEGVEVVEVARYCERLVQQVVVDSYMYFQCAINDC